MRCGLVTLVGTTLMALATLQPGGSNGVCQACESGYYEQAGVGCTKVSPPCNESTHYSVHPFETTAYPSQDEANTLCTEKTGGWLASFKTQLDFDAFAVATTVPTAGPALLGGSDRETEGEWKWLYGPNAGEVFYKDGACQPGFTCPWMSGYPTYPNLPNDALWVYPDGAWADVEFHIFTVYYVCAVHKYQTQPPTATSDRVCMPS